MGQTYELTIAFIIGFDFLPGENPYSEFNKMLNPCGIPDGMRMFRIQEGTDNPLTTESLAVFLESLRVTVEPTRPLAGYPAAQLFALAKQLRKSAVKVESFIRDGQDSPLKPWNENWDYLGRRSWQFDGSFRFQDGQSNPLTLYLTPIEYQAVPVV